MTGTIQIVLFGSYLESDSHGSLMEEGVSVPHVDDASTGLNVIQKQPRLVSPCPWIHDKTEKVPVVSISCWGDHVGGENTSFSTDTREEDASHVYI